MDFQVAQVACSFMVMATSKDGPSKRGVGGDVNTTFIGEDSLSILPIRQTGTEGWGNGSIHGLQCLKDKRVEGRGGLDMVGEGHVDEVNEKRGWKKGDSFVFWHSRGEQIRSMREGVRPCKLGSQDMDHCEVEIC